MTDFEIKKEKETQDLGRFVIEPLPAGCGSTIGTALRRVLLSSLPGGAVAEVRFSGVPHPFTTIKGVKEDVVELVLNLKKVRFTVHGDGPYEGTIAIKGKKIVTAGDIKISSEATVANPDLKIATLTDKSAELSATLLVERGVGYKPAEEREGGKVGVIPLDSIFSPVVKVGFWVEETRVGRKANFDRLIIEIATDGTIKPSAALAQSADILSNYFGRFSGLRPAKAAVSHEEVAQSAKKEAKKAAKLIKKPASRKKKS